MNTIQLPEWTIATLALGVFLIVISGAAAGIMKGSMMVTVLWAAGSLVLGIAIGWVAGIRTERYRGKRRRQRRLAQIQEAGAKLFRAMTAPDAPKPHPTKILSTDGEMIVNRGGPPNSYHNPAADQDVAAWDTTAENLGVPVHDYRPRRPN